MEYYRDLAIIIMCCVITLGKFIETFQKLFPPKMPDPEQIKKQVEQLKEIQLLLQKMKDDGAN